MNLNPEYLNPGYYADHPKLADGRSSRLSDETIFTLLLSDGAQKEFEKQGSRVDAVQAQAVLTCIEKKYGTLLNVMALATALNRPLLTLYPKFDKSTGICPLMSGFIKPRDMEQEKDESGSVVFHLLWTRDGNFDNRPGAMFQPNHFVPVIHRQGVPRCPTLTSSQYPLLPKKDKAPMVGNSRVINGISSFFQPTKSNATKRSATKAGLNSDDGV